MTTIVVQYLPRADLADDNQRLVEDVFAELAQTQPDGSAMRHGASRTTRSSTSRNSAKTRTRCRSVPRSNVSSTTSSTDAKPAQHPPHAPPHSSATTASPRHPPDPIRWSVPIATRNTPSVGQPRPQGVGVGSRASRLGHSHQRTGERATSQAKVLGISPFGRDATPSSSSCHVPRWPRVLYSLMYVGDSYPDLSHRGTARPNRHAR